MAIFKARQIAQLSGQELWELDVPKHKSMKVEYDDGVLETTARATILSAYVYGPFYRRYPNTPALSRHHFIHGVMAGNTIKDLLGAVLFDSYDATPGVDIEELCRLATQTNNRIYNDFTEMLEEYVGSMSAYDSLEVVDHPEIARINNELEPTESSINKAYDSIRYVLNHDKALANNPIAKAVRSGIVRTNQVLQCVGPRGRCTDIDSNIFRTPVMSGYVHGVQNLAEAMIESRQASKAQVNTKDPLQAAQYINRKLQLLAETLCNLHPGDCGGGRWIPIRLTGRDLTAFAGKYYRLDSSPVEPGVHNMLSEKDKHLIGELIHVRMVFGCRHPDPQGMCAACYGELALSIPKGTNIGHIAATMLGEAITQTLLSTKHLENSANQEGSVLSEYDSTYLQENIETNTIRLSPKLKNAHIYLHILSKEATHINDVNAVDDVRILSPANLSSLTDIKLEISTHKGGSESVVLHVSDETRKSYLSVDLLGYIKKKGWSLTSTGDYKIDLKDWDLSCPLLELPLKQSDMLSYAHSIERFIKSSDGNKKSITLRSYSTPEGGLMKLYELVSARLKVNIVHLECLVKVCMIRSSARRDYRIPLAGNATEFGRYNDILAMRSLMAPMAYESQRAVLQNPYSYVVEDRNDHPLDALYHGGKETPRRIAR